MEKLYLLKTEDGEGTLIPADEVEEVVCAFDQWWYFIYDSNKPPEELSTLLGGQRLDDEIEIHDWLNKQNIQHGKIQRVGDYLYKSDAINAVIYDAREYEFFEFADLVETQLGWQYWDGSNWRDIIFDPADAQLITIDDEKELSLDYWDGSNWRSSISQKKFEHDLLYPVLEIDDQPVQGTWLLYTYSQWQGTLPCARILSEEEANALLENIDNNE